MHPGHFFSSSNVLIVAGKGGVGKTVTAAAIATAASRAGRSVLLVEVSGRSGAAPLFGADSKGYEESVVFEEAEIDGVRHGSITLKSITPDAALMEWLETHGFKRIVSRFATTGMLEVVATATPGIKDLLILGRIKAFEDEETYDLIVIDAPAAGHAVGFLRSPAGVRDAAKTGVLHRQAVEVLEMISDPDRCKVMLVTIPEETPVNELIETSFAIEEELGVHLGPVVVNSVLPGLDGLEHNVGTLATDADLDLTDDERAALATAADFRAGRLALQAEQLDRLSAALPLEQVRLPQLFGSSIGPDEVAELATVLSEAIDALPEPEDDE
ncbi:MAG: ArsA-related P-loop ATPase [Actinomycetota bacterium]